MAIGTVHRFLIFDRGFACRLDRHWATKNSTTQSQTSSPSSGSASATSSQLSDTETMQLIMGSTYSLKNMLKKLSPSSYDGSSSKVASPPASRRSSATESAPVSPTDLRSPDFKMPRETCFSFVTSNYRLNYYESPTGWKLVLLTDPGTPGAGELENLMRGLYKDIFVKHVIQNPAYRMSEPSFERPGLLLLLDEFVTSQTNKT